MRRRLEELPAGWRQVEAGANNYEAHQAPLAYVLLAIPDWLCGSAPLMSRVLSVRLWCAIAACVLQALATLALAGRLGLSRPAQASAVFLVLTSQMFAATVARVSNDFLAVPLAARLCGG